MQPWSAYVTSRLTTLFINHNLVHLYTDLYHITLGSSSLIKHWTPTASLAPGSSDTQSPLSLDSPVNGNWNPGTPVPAAQAVLSWHRPHIFSWCLIPCLWHSVVNTDYLTYLGQTSEHPLWWGKWVCRISANLGWYFHIKYSQVITLRKSLMLLQKKISWNLTLRSTERPRFNLGSVPRVPILPNEQTFWVPVKLHLCQGMWQQSKVHKWPKTYHLAFTYGYTVLKKQLILAAEHRLIHETGCPIYPTDLGKIWRPRKVNSLKDIVWQMGAWWLIWGHSFTNRWYLGLL